MASVQILRDSILTTMTARGGWLYLCFFTFVSSPGITNVFMELPKSTLVQLDFCGTKLSRLVTGIPMSNVQHQSIEQLLQLQLHPQLQQQQLQLELQPHPQLQLQLDLQLQTNANVE